jgi:HSP20 family protein
LRQRNLHGGRLYNQPPGARNTKPDPMRRAGRRGGRRLAFWRKGDTLWRIGSDDYTVMPKNPEQVLRGALSHLNLPAHSSGGTWTPNTDVYETTEALVVSLEIAGIEKNDLEITLNDRLLVVRGFRKDPCRKKPCTYRQMEIDYGFFERRIIIPRSVDAGAVRAVFVNGFLHIELPKAENSRHSTVTVIIEQTI